MDGHGTVRRVRWILLWLVAAGTLYAADRLYPVFPRQGEIALDGRLTEPAWQNAPVAGDFLPLLTQPGPVEATEFRLLHDDTHLYLGLHGREPRMTRLEVGTPDGGPVWGDDSVEVFLTAAPTGADVLRCSFSAVGKRSNVETACAWRHTEDAYTLEIRVPRTLIRGCSDTTVALWGHIGRTRRCHAGVSYSSWALLTRSFQESARFARFDLVSGVPRAEQVRQIERFVNLLDSPDLLLQVRETEAFYSRLTAAATPFGLPSGEMIADPIPDPAALLQRWHDRVRECREYRALAEHLRPRRSDGRVWTADIAELPCRQACPSAAGLLLPPVLSEAEQSLHYYHRLKALLQSTHPGL